MPWSRRPRCICGFRRAIWSEYSWMQIHIKEDQINSKGDNRCLQVTDNVNMKRNLFIIQAYARDNSLWYIERSIV